MQRPRNENENDMFVENKYFTMAGEKSMSGEPLGTKS